MTKLKNILVGFLLIWPLPLLGSTPMETARSFFKELVAVSSVETVEERTDTIGRLVQNHFDFTSFYKKSLIDHWGRWTVLEQLSFDRSFRQRFIEHLAKNADRLKSMHETEVGYKLTRLPNGIVKVTAAGKHKGEEIPVSLYLVSNHGTWKVFDLDVAGANLSRNYRGRFNYLMRTKGYAQLLSSLRPEGTGYQVVKSNTSPKGTGYQVVQVVK